MVGSPRNERPPARHSSQTEAKAAAVQGNHKMLGPDLQGVPKKMPHSEMLL